jgi:hypothetical protein
MSKSNLGTKHHAMGRQKKQMGINVRLAIEYPTNPKEKEKKRKT